MTKISFSNEQIIEAINNEVVVDEKVEKVELYAIAFENSKYFGVALFVNEMYVLASHKFIFETDSVVVLQSRMKEIGQEIHKEYKVIAKCTVDLFGGLDIANVMLSYL